QNEPKIGEHLLRLPRQIADANGIARRVDGDLAGDEGELAGRDAGDVRIEPLHRRGARRVEIGDCGLGPRRCCLPWHRVTRGPLASRAGNALEAARPRLEGPCRCYLADTIWEGPSPPLLGPGACERVCACTLTPQIRPEAGETGQGGYPRPNLRDF